VSFKCIRCGECCKDIPLYISEVAMFKYILQLEDKWKESNLEYHEDRSLYKLKGPCPFLENSICKIYSFRPNTCRIFPLGNECSSSLKITETENRNE
jgi:Fe-S-cluster containining protein